MTASAIAESLSATAEGCKNNRPTEKLRIATLRQLYARREALDDLIRSFEVYDRMRRGPERCSGFIAERKCS